MTTRRQRMRMSIKRISGRRKKRAVYWGFPGIGKGGFRRSGAVGRGTEAGPADYRGNQYPP